MTPQEELLVQNLVAFVLRLSSHLAKARPYDKLPKHATDFLVKNNLTSPLRKEKHNG